MVAIAITLIGCDGSDSTEQTEQSADNQIQQQTRTPSSEVETPEQEQPALATEPDEQAAQSEPTSEHSQQQEAAETEQAASEQATDAAAAQQATIQQSEPAEEVPEGTRIISLFGDITEILYALGVEDFVVGVDVSSVFPEAAEELPDVGFAGALNAEGILALSPTIVIGGGIVPPGPPGVLEQLDQAGVEVLILPDLVGLDAPGIKIRLIGDAIGIPRRAEALALQVEHDIELAKPKLDPTAETAETTELKVLFVYLRRGGIQLVSGAGREAETIITASGGVDAGAAAGIDGWQPLSPEALLSIDPDVYLVMQLGFDAVGGLDGLLDIPGMGETKAGKHGRVIVMEDILLLGFGPRMAETIVQLRDYLDEVRASLKESSGAEE